MTLYTVIYSSRNELDNLLRKENISIEAIDSYGWPIFIDDNTGRTISDEDIYDILSEHFSRLFTFSASVARITYNNGRFEINLKAKNI